MANYPEYDTTGKKHPYHIVRPSIWPLIGAFAGGLLAVGALLFMHDIKFGEFEFGSKILILGVIAILAVMFFWWKDVIYEAVVEKAHSPIAGTGLRYGMALFIASEIMFFVAFFWAFYDASLLAGEIKQFLRVEYTGGVWPPAGVKTIAPSELPLLMTMVLLLSGCTVTWAHHAILQGNNDETSRAIGITVILGVLFLAIQIYEYTHAHFGFTDGVYASTFYMATGFHGFHVMIGTIFLFVCWRRTKKGHFTPDRHFGLEAAAWYWHFVDVVWLFLFISIYFWGNTIGTGAAG